MTPFKAMYGRDATAIHDYTSGSSTTESIDSSLIEHQRLLQLLKDALATSRQKMINQANKKRLHKEFQIGEFVYLRLQKHRQSSVHNRPNAKLAKRFSGPFKILERIGAVAYRLDLPPTSKVNPVFHVSLLKTCYETEPSSDIPLEWDTTPVTEHHPESILARHVSPEGTTQLLIKWTQPMQLQQPGKTSMTSNYDSRNSQSTSRMKLFLQRRALIRPIAAQAQQQPKLPSVTGPRGTSRSLSDLGHDDTARVKLTRSWSRYQLLLHARAVPILQPLSHVFLFFILSCY